MFRPFGPRVCSVGSPFGTRCSASSTRIGLEDVAPSVWRRLLVPLERRGTDRFTLGLPQDARVVLAAPAPAPSNGVRSGARVDGTLAAIDAAANHRVLAPHLRLSSRSRNLNGRASAAH
jgi:hypothetical protein